MTKKKSSESAGPDTPQADLPVRRFTDAIGTDKPRVTLQTSAGGVTIIGPQPQEQEEPRND